MINMAGDIGAFEYAGAVGSPPIASGTFVPTAPGPLSNDTFQT